MDIAELEQLTGQPRRNIRFLIAEGVVPEPSGTGRGASYGPEHVSALRVYASMKADGVNSLALIRQAVEDARRAESEIVVEAIPGVTVRIDVDVLGATAPADLAKSVQKAVRDAASAFRKGRK